MTQAAKLTRNQARKHKYATLAAEGPAKDARNAAIEAALDEGVANVTSRDVVDGFESHAVIDYDSGEKTMIRVPRVTERKQIIAPSMPAAPKSGSRAAKRAALKARRRKRMPDRTLHKRGLRRCGNVGCDRCRGRT
jgi:hypothetical protein